MFGYEHKVLLLLLTVNFLLQKSYADTEDNKDDDGNDKPAERIMMTAYLLPSQYPQLVASDHGQLANLPPVEGLLGAASINSLLAAYLQSKDAKRTTRVDIDHYVRMLMDGLLAEWRPFHPHTDAEALQMVRDFIASRDVSLDLAKLKPEHANHQEWRERLKHLLFHYVKQPYVKQHPGLHRAMKWYLNRLKHTIWVRRRLSLRRIGITRMNLLFSYLQSLDHAANQRQYRFDIYKETERTAAMKKRLVQLSTSPEVKLNAELTAAFEYYIGKLTEALEEINKQKSTLQLSEIPIRNIPLAATPTQMFPKKITTYIDIVQDFIEKKKKLEDTKDILDGQSLDRVGGIRTFLEHYLTTAEVKGNATLTEAIDKFLSKLKKIPSHHLLDKHLKRETMQKMVTKYEVVYEYLSKLQWKRSGPPDEILQQALDNPDIQKNTTLMEAINFYLGHSPKEQEEEVEEETPVLEEEQAVEEGKTVHEEQLPVEQEKTVGEVVVEEKVVGEQHNPVEEEGKAVEEETAVEEQAVEEEQSPIEEEKAVGELVVGEKVVDEQQKPVVEEEETAVHEEQSPVEEDKAVVEKVVDEQQKPVEEEEETAVHEEQSAVEEDNAVGELVVGEQQKPVEEEKAVHEEQSAVEEEKTVGEKVLDEQQKPVEEEGKAVEEEEQGIEGEETAVRKRREIPNRKKI